MRSDAIDLASKMFGQWKVITYEGFSRQAGTMWLCRCSCGRESIVKSSALRHGRSTRCRTCGNKQQAIKNSRPGAAMRKAISNTRCAAQRRGYGWQLTEEQFMALTQQNCHYCNRPPNNCKVADSGERFVSSGIDRRDNKQGYTVDNCVPCCKVCNVAKNTMGYDEFVQWIKCVHAHLGKQ